MFPAPGAPPVDDDATAAPANDDGSFSDVTTADDAAADDADDPSTDDPADKPPPCNNSRGLPRSGDVLAQSERVSEREPPYASKSAKKAAWTAWPDSRLGALGPD